MALEMQHRLTELNTEWLSRGYEHPLRARIGINTGFCNVGNFGSPTRMDYTVIGAEANLAARLASIAEPGGIVISYETWAHVRDIVKVRRLEPAKVKGISREVVPYEVVMPEDEIFAAAVVQESGPSLEQICGEVAPKKKASRKRKSLK